MTTKDAATDVPMIRLTIDGREVSVPKGTTVYNAAKSLQIPIPIFCYMDRMPPFGACRMCLVEVEKMGKLQASCTLEAQEGMVVRTQSDPAVQGRKGILELLLINHPLDCPICDRGGECPLQENALSYGPGMSRFFEQKRQLDKALPLGSVLMLDRERCIVCARCTRFSDLIAGDHALEFQDRGFKTVVGTPGDKPVESKFIGNTIMICPVGALTSQVYRFRARPWDNDTTASSCTLCPVGCSMQLDSRDGEIMRTRSKENRDVNDVWLCDKGWFGYEFSSNEERLQSPLIRREGKLVPTSWEEALSCVADKIKSAKKSGEVAALGGNPLTVEENYLYQKLMRTAAATPHIDHRVGMPIQSLAEEYLPAGMEISFGDCEELSYAIFLGLDVTEEFPLLWLRLKQAANKGAKLYFLGNYAPEVAKHLNETIVHAPGQELDLIAQKLPALIEEGKRGAIFVGGQYLHQANRAAILEALLQLRGNQDQLSINILEGSGNSCGARAAGMRPDSAPLGGSIGQPGLNTIQIFEKAAKDSWQFLYVAAADPATQLPSKLWVEARAKIGFLVVQDLFLTETAQQADLVLPTLSYVEKEGSFLNIEGRIQKLQPGKAPPANLLSDSEIFRRIAALLQVDLAIDPEFQEFLNKPFSKTQFKKHSSVPPFKKPSEGLSALFSKQLFDEGNRMKHNPHLIQLAKQPKVRIHPNVAEKYGIAQGGEVLISAEGKSLVALASLDKTVSEAVVVLPLGFDQLPTYELGANQMNGLSITLTKAG